MFLVMVKICYVFGQVYNNPFSPQHHVLFSNKDLDQLLRVSKLALVYFQSMKVKNKALLGLEEILSYLY